ncbi:M23 family metallopeptidase [Oricola nitratireducens]|uniref:M23 family metallopeptidase n=1 Tax=Oricola nitratireducens TaxID=2775868 RepID=UPI001FEDB473|nr:M23 family metallopeptidase [Oricola nitratireducens]
MSSTAVFGKRKEPHTIIIAQGDRISHFTVRPWVVALAASLLAAAAVGYLLATSYLMLRDDILNAAIARQARMQYAYEDRIAALRSQVDRITSYRLLDQQIMESKVAELLTRQSVLAKRSGRLAPLLKEAANSGLTPETDRLDPASVPVPEIGDTSAASKRTLFRLQEPVEAGLQQAAVKPPDSPKHDETEPVLALSRLGTALNHLEKNQIDQISALASSARSMRRQIVADAHSAGLPLKAPEVESTGTGGPFIPARPGANAEAFDTELDNLNRELDALDTVRGKIRAFPIANPAPGHRITSGFGNRRDPIIGRSAFHAGIDFSVVSGTPIHATAAGTVIRAGRNGGYGNMIEIRHVSGLTTRYAHLSRILVKKGQKVAAGARIGLSGSTGRSTGPHLHYEVREDNKAVNPMNFLKAGKRLEQYL